MPITAICHELLNSAMANFGEDLDHSGIVRAQEPLASHEIGQSNAPRVTHGRRNLSAAMGISNIYTAEELVSEPVGL